MSFATWNTGGPQKHKWSEYVTQSIGPLYDEILQYMDTSKDMLVSITTFTQTIFGKMQHHIETHFTPEAIEQAGALWNAENVDKTLRGFMTMDADPTRKISWGDRYFPHRPTPLNMTLTQDPATFTPSGSPGGTLRFRRFETAWIKHVFTQLADGTLKTQMPPNKYNTNDDVSQILAYMNLAAYDLSIVALFHGVGGTIDWAAVRLDTICQIDSEKQAHQTVQFVQELAETDMLAIALQEGEPGQFGDIKKPSDIAYIEGEHTAQMTSLFVRNATINRNLFCDDFPQQDALYGRVTGATGENATGRETLYVSVHCKPPEIHRILEMALSKVTATINQIVVMGDFNTTRDDLYEFSKTVRHHNFRATWDSLLPVPNTVCGVRTKWIQTQLHKGGDQRRAPKDHILVWTADGCTPNMPTHVIVNTEFDILRPDHDLCINLPSDHAAVIASTF